MSATFRLELRSTETRPSKETQESVLPAMSQKFGRQVSIHSAELDEPDQRRAATIGTVDVEDPGVLQAVYEYLQPHNLVKVGRVTADRGGVAARRVHEVDRDAIEARDGVEVVADVRGDLLVHVRGEPRGESPGPVRDEPDEND
ncbi:MAG: hypothetical protein ABEJ90_02320 [Halobacterium sp.]